MVGAGGRDGIAQRLPVARAALVHGERLPLDVHRELLRGLSELGHRFARAVGQQGADPLAPRDQLQAAHHGLAVAEPQLQPARVLVGEQAVLIALHGERDHHAGRDGIQPQGVADLVALGDGPQIVDAAVGADGPHRLVLGAAIDRVDVVLVVVHLHHPLAADGAGIAALAPGEDGIAHGAAGDLLGALEGSVLKVARGQGAHVIQVDQAAIGAGVVQPLGLFAPVLAHPAGQLFESVRIGGLDIHAAAHRHRLELFAAHHRAHARAAGRVPQVVDDAGIGHQVLAGRADHGQAGALVAGGRLDRLLGGQRIQAPEVVSRLQRGPLGRDIQPDGARGAALDHQRVIAGPLELGPKEPADIGLAPAAGQRAFAAHGAAPRARHRQARDGAARHHQHVLRAQGIGPLGHLLEQIVGHEPGPAQITPVEGVIGLFRPDAPLGQVRPQDLAAKSLGHAARSLLYRCVQRRCMPPRMEGSPTVAHQRGSAEEHAYYTRELARVASAPRAQP